MERRNVDRVILLQAATKENKATHRYLKIAARRLCIRKKKKTLDEDMQQLEHLWMHNTRKFFGLRSVRNSSHDLQLVVINRAQCLLKKEKFWLAGGSTAWSF